MKTQAKLQKGFKPINLRSVCGFPHQHRAASVCHLASFSLFSLNSAKKCKNSINKPLKSGTLLLWHIQAHSFQLLDKKQRDRQMECAPKARPDGPLGDLCPWALIHPPSLNYYWVKLATLFLE